MSQIFRSRSEGGTGRRLERDLEALEQQAATASPGYETQYLTRAANLCVEAGQPERALGYFGRAIDAFLDSGRFGAAEVTCRKVLAIAPDTVRARSTLACIAIGRGYGAETLAEIGAYVEAAQRAGREALAVKQLVMMAEAAVEPELRERLAEHLLDLGEAAEADRILGAVHAERNGLREPRPSDGGTLWRKVLRAALIGPEELKSQGSTEGEEQGDDFLPSLI
jgi:tetratricopeptide (TPR) repeat protein